ncbi:hypothetical protein DMN91_000243 [Ooceraea biroi]|uniref:Uncharacterized protein n=1 Tax=Ooceraea biroi TaxID=2015173 RepID=A0A026WEB3_OOCBI|nr:uncharacterized protein LOC105280259 [Ooceraea biroi]XP_026829731.1 uncharacterized protein LOC105280259 [Ooceraea biroi]XP_026829734.1 uncharacterized protein LOC105280259 [Ooceraea biroi]EZA54006.1 hypothetical protein X777_05855 [Ooceraea biroi]RLU26448.1 hypothetical protein DMN91_000243 [Ooceraea biroi]
MGTSRQQDRSLGSGISLPQWMKGKMDNRFDFDDVAFSPPSYDDNFFYIRYQKSQNSELPKEGLKRIVPEVLNENNITSSTNQIMKEQSISDLKEAKIDFSKHPLPCQPFIPAVNSKADDIRPKKPVTSGYVKPKSQGTDDGFHGESALCGKSIVHVASQMMSGKLTKVLAPDSSSQQMESSSRNVSKSLPATPLTSPTASPDNSPKARRKIHANRYFTGAFVPDREKYQGNWILASILGQSREIITAKIEEEDEAFADMEPHKPLNRKRSISSQNLTYIGQEDKSADKSAIHMNLLEAKPSELREMNFWSPTSM